MIHILRVFYAFMLIISALTIINDIENFLEPKTLVAIIGIVGSILFFLKLFQYYYLAVFWIIVQVPYIAFGDIIFDLSQLWKWSVNFSLSLNSLTIGLNIHALLLFLVPYIIRTKFLNKEIVVKPFTEITKSDFGEKFVFELTGITESKKLVADVDLDIEGEKYTELFFTPIKDQRFKKANITLVQKGTAKIIKGIFTYEFK